MNADPLARWYRWLEYAGFGRALERRRREFLGGIEDARRALVLGDGDGRFLVEFLRINRRVRADVVDSSAGMLRLSRNRVGLADGSRVSFYHADATTWEPPAVEYDLIAAHFFLDCFGEGEAATLIARFTAFATSDARWVVSEFRQPPGGLARWWARRVIVGLYVLFGVLTGLKARRLPDYGAALRAAGWGLEREVVAHGGMLVSQLWRRV